MRRGREARRSRKKQEKKRAKRRLIQIWNWREDDLTPRDIGINARTRKSCSAWCCGNPRKHFGDKKIRELKYDIRHTLDYEEAGVPKDFFRR